MRNPIHYIAMNKPTETVNLLASYNMPAPQTEGELIEAVDYACDIFGQNFINKMTAFHPDKEVILLENYSDFTSEVKEKQSKPMDVTTVKEGNSRTDEALKIHKINQMLLLSLVAVTLIYIGTKLAQKAA